MYSVGDLIEFDHDDGIRVIRERGRIKTVGKHGYWIDHNPACYGTGSLRCDFNDAILIEEKNET
jgi:hypothetical protein